MSVPEPRPRAGTKQHEERGGSNDETPLHPRRGLSQPGGFGIVAHAEDVDGARDIFRRHLAEVLEAERELVAHRVAHGAGDVNAARLRHRLQPRRDVHTVAVDVVGVADDVADIDADAELDPSLRRHRLVPLGHAALHIDRAAHGIDRAGELDQHPIAGGLDDTAAMAGDGGIDNSPPGATSAHEACRPHPHPSAGCSRPRPRPEWPTAGAHAVRRGLPRCSCVPTPPAIELRIRSTGSLCCAECMRIDNIAINRWLVSSMTRRRREWLIRG